MQDYYCQCGSYRSFGSMGPNPCAECDKCHTTPTLNGYGQPKKPEPHDWVQEIVETDEGPKTLTVCRYCNIKKIDFDKSRTS